MHHHLSWENTTSAPGRRDHQTQVLGSYLYRTMHRIVIFLLGVFWQLGGITSLQMHIKHGSDGTSIMDKIHFGKDWFVYITARIYDILHTPACNRGACSPSYSMSVSGIRTRMFQAVTWHDPCDHINNTLFDHTFPHSPSAYNVTTLHFDISSKLCGDFSMIYGYVPARLEWYNAKQYEVWHIRISVNKLFRVNVTFTSLEVERYFPLCQTVRARVVQEYRGMGLGVMGEFCPGNPPKTFYSDNEALLIILHHAPAYRDMFLQTTHIDNPIGRISFLYQIYDKDLTVTKSYIFGGLRDYPFSTHHNRVSDGRLLYPEMSINSTELHLYRYYAMAANKYMFNIHAVVETSFTVIYVFSFGASLGGTPSIKSASLECNGTFTHVTAFNGPPVDLLIINSLLVQLQEWNCGYMFNETESSETLQGSIGDLTMLLVVDIRESPYYFFHVQLKHVYLGNFSSRFFSNVLTLRGNFEPGITLNQNTTSFHSVRVNADSQGGFVKLKATYLSFQGYTHSGCDYGGIFIFSSQNTSMQSLTGSLCSGHAARQWEKLYGQDGITLGRRVLIIVKQYQALSEVNAVLNFQIDDCLGLVNHLPTDVFPYEEYIDTPGARTIKEYKHYQRGINDYYRWREKPVLGIKRRSEFCLKLQYTQFNQHPLETNRYLGISSHTTVLVGSVNAMVSSTFFCSSNQH